MTDRDRLFQRLTAAPWGIAAMQVPDFAFWLSGLDERADASLLLLTGGEVAAAHERLDGETQPARLVDRWVFARAAALAHRNADAEAVEWLR